MKLAYYWIVIFNLMLNIKLKFVTFHSNKMLRSEPLKVNQLF